MLFARSFTVLTTHTETAPLESIIPIAHGIITWVSVLMPKGCHGLVRCKLKYHEHTIFPSNEDMYLMTDGFPLEWNEYYECYQPPYELKFVGWADSTTYDHVVTARVAVLPRKAIVASSIVDAIKGIIGLVAPKRVSLPIKEK